MSDEQTPVTEPVAAEPETPATPSEAPKAEQKTEPDWRAAYVGLQRTQNKLHKRVEDVLQTNAALVDAVSVLKEGQGVLLKQTVGEDEAKAIEARQAQQAAQAANIRAAQTAEQYIVQQTGLFLRVLQKAGVDPKDPTIDWAQDATNVAEWAQRVGPSIESAIDRANEERIKRHEATLQAKTQKEVAAEAEARVQRELKSREIDKIDTAKGGSSTSLRDRLLAMDPTSPEFAKLKEDIKSGRLTL